VFYFAGSALRKDLTTLGRKNRKYEAWFYNFCFQLFITSLKGISLNNSFKEISEKLQELLRDPKKLCILENSVTHPKLLIMDLDPQMKIKNFRSGLRILL